MAVAILIIAGVAWFLVDNKTVSLNSLDYKNATYLIEGQRVTLTNGRAEVASAPASDSKTVTQFFGNVAKGDLNGDAIPDLTFILTQDTGGSGTFYYVVASLQTTAGGYQGTSAVLLGDRIAPQTTEIKNAQVVVNYTDRKAGEPMTTKPSVGVTKYFIVKGTTLTEANKTDTSPPVTLPPVACTKEAKICPDGSAVGRIGPNCAFAACPTTQPIPIVSCLKDSDCSSAQYVCEETSGTGTACSSSDPTCVPTHTILSGVCKIKSGGLCSANTDCAAGNLCNSNVCTSPIGRECNGPSDVSCPANFQCVQGCGPPVVRQDSPPPGYFCQLNGYNRPCPICLAKNTLIDTPQGAVAVQDIQKGDTVWTVTSAGERVPAVVMETGKTAVPADHKMVELILADGRTVHVSLGHPTVDGRTAGALSTGDTYDGSRVVSASPVSYGDGYTYDILPSGDTGFYFANGIRLGSTLHP